MNFTQSANHSIVVDLTKCNFNEGSNEYSFMLPEILQVDINDNYYCRLSSLHIPSCVINFDSECIAFITDGENDVFSFVISPKHIKSESELASVLNALFKEPLCKQFCDNTVPYVVQWLPKKKCFRLHSNVIREEYQLHLSSTLMNKLGF